MRLGGLTIFGSGLLALLVGTSIASTAELRVIAPSAPGSGWDQLAQALKQAAAESSDGPGVAVVNVPGGSGTIGLSQFAGSTSNDELLVTGLTMMDAAVLNRSPVALDRLTPIARLATEPFAVVVPTGSALRSIDDLKDALATGSAKITWAGGPIGGVDHVAAILLARALGLEPVRLNYVPFLTSAEAAGAAAEDKVNAAILGISEVQAAVGENRLLMLGVSAPVRLPGLNAPTLTEAGIPLVFANWRGLVARSGLPEADRLRLEAFAASAVASKAWRALLEKKGWREALVGGDTFGALIRDDQIRIKEALKSAGLLKRPAD